MLRSMTGFGAASREGPDRALSAEVRSVNHRHLLVKTRIPGDLSFLEGEIEALVKKRLERGTVSVSLRVDSVGAAGALHLDAETAERYQRQIQELAQRLGLSPSVSMDTLLQLPGVVAGAQNVVADAPQLRRMVLGVLDEALGRLIDMRETEGRAIAADIVKHAGATTRLVKHIEKRMPTVVRTLQHNLEKRVGELLENRQPVASTDVAREVAILCDRLDVSEEISRLKSHLDQLDAFLTKGGRIGRKLDFLVQEIFREINTIGSKCSDAKVAHWVVDAKTHAERLREQVQNVE